MDFVTWIRSQWDRVAGFALTVAGAVALILGYQGVSGSPYVAEELAYIISGGIGGLFLLGVGATMLISADLHDEWRKLDRIEAALREAARDEAGSATPPSPGGGAANSSDADPSLLGRAAALRAASGTAALSPRFKEALALAVAAVLASAGVIIGGWNHAAGVADPDPAIDGLIAAVAGLIAAAAVAYLYTLWLKRIVRARMSRLLGPIAMADFLASLPAGATAPPAGGEVRLPSQAGPQAMTLEPDTASVPAIRLGRRPAASRLRAMTAEPERRPYAYTKPRPDRRAKRPPEPAPRVWVGEGLRHFHRAGCALLDGVDARELDRADLDPELVPCEICQA